MLHAMMLEATDGRLFFAPISSHPLKILDLGTGTGIWAIEMAGQYPSAEVQGIGMRKNNLSDLRFFILRLMIILSIA